uniref:Uncharacterized protein n=1 Tax=uncultured firmicutes bacterium contig_31 TaxID=1643554 RepID=A0A141GND1_9FIRM|nr:hypothetical protein [uncultured firmicutes bacterium contig_31]
MGKLEKINHKGTEVYISTLEMLRQDNINFNRPERVKAIEEKMRQINAANGAR